MALTHAILVALSEQSGSGFELARRFDQSIGYFWTAAPADLPTLRAMEGDGWVSATAVVSGAVRTRRSTPCPRPAAPNCPVGSPIPPTATCATSQ